MNRLEDGARRPWHSRPSTSSPAVGENAKQPQSGESEGGGLGNVRPGFMSKLRMLSASASTFDGGESGLRVVYTNMLLAFTMSASAELPTHHGGRPYPH